MIIITFTQYVYYLELLIQLLEYSIKRIIIKRESSEASNLINSNIIFSISLYVFSKSLQLFFQRVKSEI